MNAVTHAVDSCATPEAAPDLEVRRLRWRCRRGTKELDVILERFAREALPHATREECCALAELLALPDPLLADYLVAGRTPSEPRLAGLVDRIRDLCRSEVRSAVFCRQ